MENFHTDQKCISTWYVRYKKRVTIRYICVCMNLIAGILLSFFLLFLVMVGQSKYVESKEHLVELKNERLLLREEIQQSSVGNFLGKFEQIQEDMTDEASNHLENYIVEIEGKELLIDRNNIFVSDNAQVLKDRTKRKIYQMNKEFSQYNNGQQLMVVTIQSLPKSVTIESFASELFNKLGIGQSDKDNGILYVMAIDDRKTRIEVGYGLESILTDSKAGSILENKDTQSDFKDEAYDTGVNRILDQLYNQIGSLTPEYNMQIQELEEEVSKTKEVIIMLASCSLLSLVISVVIFIQTKKFRKQVYQLSEEEIHFLYLTAPITIFRSHKLKEMINIGRVMSKYKDAKRRGKNILVGNRLYDLNGSIVTDDYSSYVSNSSSDSSGDSFGGGSSGGGGASGGW